MAKRKQLEWIGNELCGSVDFGLLLFHAYQDQFDDNRYRYRVGSKQSKGRYTTLNGAKLAGLREVKELCQTILSGVDSMIEECEIIFIEAQAEHLKKVHKKNEENKAKHKPVSLLDLEG